MGGAFRVIQWFHCSLEKKVGEGVTGTRGMIDEDTETEDETELVEVDDEQGHQWDCESILRCA